MGGRKRKFSRNRNESQRGGGSPGGHSQKLVQEWSRCQTGWTSRGLMKKWRKNQREQRGERKKKEGEEDQYGLKQATRGGKWVEMIERLKPGGFTGSILIFSI